MARQTRQQRRARRAEAAADGGAVADRTRARQAQVRPTTAPEPETAERRVPGGGSRRFISESVAELKKVEWPRRPQLIQATVVVLVACTLVGAYLFGVDLVFERVVKYIV